MCRTHACIHWCTPNRYPICNHKKISHHSNKVSYCSCVMSLVMQSLQSLQSSPSVVVACSYPSGGLRGALTALCRCKALVGIEAIDTEKSCNSDSLSNFAMVEMEDGLTKCSVGLEMRAWRRCQDCCKRRIVPAEGSASGCRKRLMGGGLTCIATV